MNIRTVTQSVKVLTTDALVVAAAQNNNGEEPAILFSPVTTAVDKSLNALITTCWNEKEFKANHGELLTLHPQGQLAAKRVIVVGLGSQRTITAQTIRRASAIAIRHLQGSGAHHVTLALDWSSLDSAQLIEAEVEGALLGAYTFTNYQQRNEQRKGIESLSIYVEGDAQTVFEQAIEKGRILAETTNFARDLVNEPPNVLTPEELASRAVTMARQVGLEYEVFELEKIRELRMGGLLAVGQGSAQTPRFIVLRYHGAPQAAEKGIALIGKGITFDTGGISIKPQDGMDAMKSDMAGAATVLAAIQAVALLKLPVNATAIVPTAENMVSGTAYRPGDILRLMNGKTIEIVNTDAEGRLILADALSYAVAEGFSPVIDLATLTGGIVIALGKTMTGLFSNDEELAQQILDAARNAGEKFWQMPLDEEYSEQIKSDVADVKQTGGRMASSVTAAKMLENFVSNTKWAHLDIAGTSYFDSKKPYQEKGGTGVGVRTLVELLTCSGQE